MDVRQGQIPSILRRGDSLSDNTSCGSDDNPVKHVFEVCTWQADAITILEPVEAGGLCISASFRSFRQLKEHDQVFRGPRQP